MSFFIGTPHAKGAGYFFNDDRASGGTKQEADVRTCPHCQAVILMQEWRKVENGSMTGGFCMRCNAPVCGHCNKRMQTHGCEPFIAKLESALKIEGQMARFRKLAGLEPPEPPRELIVSGDHRS